MIQWFNFAVVKWLIVSPSIITEVKISVGPENKASQATNATGLILYLKALQQLDLMPRLQNLEL